MKHLEDILISEIDVSDDRARSLDPAWVEGLAEIINAEGLIQPVAVRVVGDRLSLMAGAHRFAACQSLGWETIPAVVYGVDFTDGDLIETLENLARRELNALDKAKHFARFKDAYEAKHGLIERGGDRRSDDAQDQSARNALWSFHEVIAERTGFARRSIFDYLAIWNGLAPDSYERLCALESVANNKAQLKQLSEQSPDLQDQVLGIIETDGPGNTVGEALTLISEGRLTSKAEKKLSVARGAWGRLNQDERLEFLSGYEEDVRQYAIQKGWIDE